MKVTTKGGVVLEGTPEQVQKILASLGEPMRGVYTTSKGNIVNISEMNDFHLAGAIALKTRQWAETLKSLPLMDLANSIANGDTSDEYVDLITELIKRTSK